MANKEAKLKIIVDAQDNTRGALNKLNQDLGTTKASTAALTTTMIAAGAAAATAVAGFLGYGLKIAADLQTAEIGLTTLLGSADKARETVDRLKKEAARTPFELPGLTQATQLLTSVTKDGNKSIDILLDIGEALTAMGKGQAELDRIVVNLQQVASIGHASMVDIKQFAYAGIPIFEMLEKHFASSGTSAIVDNSKAMTKNAGEVKKLEQQLSVTLQRQKDFTKTTSDATKMATNFKVDELRSKIASLNGTMGSLAATNGKAAASVTSVEDAIANGQVTFELLTGLFDKANDEGGQFFNGFKNNSHSFNQALANMKDAFGIFAADIVNNSGLLNGLSTSMLVIADVLGNYQLHMRNAHAATMQFLDYIDEKTGAISFFKEMWAALTDQFNTGLKPALIELWTALQPFQPFLEAMAQVFGIALLDAVVAIVVVLGGLSILLLELFKRAVQLATFISETFLAVWNTLTDAIAGTVSWVDALISSLKEALKLMARLTPGGSLTSGLMSMVGGGKSKDVNDAIIAPNGNIITTHPDDYIIATKTPQSLGGGGVSIVVTGNTFLDQDTAERIGDLIMGRLRLSNQLT